MHKWGIIGPGKIAHVFAEAVANEGYSEIRAVASRDVNRGKEFAQKHNIPIVYDSYQSLIEDPLIDIVYVATPHSFHERQVISCLENKKAVLCEKPMTVNLDSALRMIGSSRKNNTFLMEAMWTRFMPATLKVMELIKEGQIGEVKYVHGDFGDSFPFDQSSRVYDLKLGAGSILDIGIYPLFLSLLLLGKPDSIKAVGHLAVTGADDLVSAITYYKKGCIGSFMSTTVMKTPTTAEIIGTGGVITLHPPWYKTKSLSLAKIDKPTQVLNVPFDGNGFEFQIHEVLTCMDKGVIESSMMSHDFTLLLSETMEEICKQCGVSYTPQ
ncbi:MAG: Gfo/Idh/MocA family oxidoreductase [Chryseolinea sp.]